MEQPIAARHSGPAVAMHQSPAFHSIAFAGLPSFGLVHVKAVGAVAALRKDQHILYRVPTRSTMRFRYDLQTDRRRDSRRREARLGRRRTARDSPGIRMATPRLWTFRACAMHPVIIIATAWSLYGTWLGGRYPCTFHRTYF